MKFILRSMSTSHKKPSLLSENCDRGKKKSETDGASGTSFPYQPSPLIAIYYDRIIVIFFLLVGCANDLLSATGEINPGLTLSVLMLGGKK